MKTGKAIFTVIMAICGIITGSIGVEYFLLDDPKQWPTLITMASHKPVLAIIIILTGAYVLGEAIDKINKIGKAK